MPPALSAPAPTNFKHSHCTTGLAQWPLVPCPALEGVTLECMIKKSVYQTLTEHKPTLIARYGVKKLALFGSHAKGVATEDSDIDVLVEFSGVATSKSYFGLQFYLEDLFGKPVDLVTEKALRPEFRHYVERDLITI
jgi:uncharacterized protein